jgi:hypothetical protein
VARPLRYPDPDGEETHFSGWRHCQKELADGSVCGASVGVVACGTFREVKGMFGGITKLGNFRCSAHPAIVPKKKAGRAR